GATGRYRDFTERTVMIVAIEQTGGAVASDVNIRPSVVVEICRRGSHTIGAAGLPIFANEDHGRGPSRAGDARLLGHVGKRTVSAIAIKDVGAAGEAQRPTRHRNVVVHAVGSLARLGRAGGLEIHVIRHKQIELTVTIVVQKTAACAPAVFGSGHAGLLGHIGKRAVAVVVVENVVAKISDEEIVEAVVVVISDATGLPPSGAGQAS